MNTPFEMHLDCEEGFFIFDVRKSGITMSAGLRGENSISFEMSKQELCDLIIMAELIKYHNGVVKENSND